MSIQSIAAVEVERNTAGPKSKLGDESKPKTETLVDAIPTEVIAPYTAILAIIVANAEAGAWEVGRWVMYGIGILLVPMAVYLLWQRASPQTKKRRLPVAGMVGSTIAFGAWGLVMPGAPLTYSIGKASTLTIWTFIIVTVVTAIIAWLPLNKQARDRQ